MNFDLSKIAQIGTIVLIVVQYIKGPIPEKFVPYVSIVIGILVGLLFEYKGGGTPDIVTGIVNGVLGAVGADTGYGFLNGTAKSPAFSLPSKAQLKKKSKRSPIH